MNRILPTLTCLALLVTILTAGCRGPATTASPVAPMAALGPIAYPLTMTDDLGAAVTMAREPQRIISLAPSVTETCFALGLGPRVVGVTTYCNYPPEARQKPRVGGYIDASEEKIIALAPDLVLCTRGTPTAFIAGLRAAGLQVFGIDQVSFSDITDSIIAIGRLCNVAPAADAVVTRLQAALESLSPGGPAPSPDRQPRALFVVQLEPQLFVAGPESFQDDILRAAGARNVAGIAKPNDTLSLEAVVASNPQILILPDQHSGKAMTAAATLARLRQSPAWRGVSAVRDGRVAVISADLVSVPGPRLAEGMAAIGRALHPDAGVATR